LTGYTARGQELRGRVVDKRLSLLVIATTALLLASLKVRVLLIALLALVGTLSVALLIIYPFSALFILVFLAYGHVSAAFLPGIFSGLLILTLAAWTIRFLLSSEETASLTRVDATLIMYICMLLLSMLFSPILEVGVGSLLLTAKWLIFYLLVSRIVRDERQAVLVSAAVILGAGLSGFVGLWDFSSQGIRVTLRAIFRAAGLATNPNELAIVMVTALPISIYMLGIVKGRISRLFLAGLTLVMIAANLVTLARTGLIVMLIVLLIIAALERRRKWVRVFVPLFVLSLPFLIPRGFWFRFAATGLLRGDFSAMVRTGAMKAGLKMFSENPITGVGFGAYFDKSTQYGDIISPLVAHNMYLHVLAESGILGLGAMLVLIWSTFRGMRLAAKEAAGNSAVHYLARGYMIAYVAFLLCGVFTSIQINQTFWFMPAASIFLLHVARTQKHEAW